MTILTGFHRLGQRIHIGFVEVTVCGLDRYLAAVRHRVARIDGEIENCVLELIGVGVSAPEASQPAPSPDEAASPTVLRKSSQVPATSLLASMDFGIERLLTREGEQPARSTSPPGARPSSAMSLPRTMRDTAADGSKVGNLTADHIQSALDDGEKVVEVVGDPAGELSDGVHLLGLPERLFRLLARLVLCFQLTRALTDRFPPASRRTPATAPAARFRSVTSTLTPTTRTGRRSAS